MAQQREAQLGVAGDAVESVARDLHRLVDGVGAAVGQFGSFAVDDPVALQRIRDRLGEEQIDALLRKWLARLPHPFTAADRAAGYRYELSILQAEFSLTPAAR